MAKKYDPALSHVMSGTMSNENQEEIRIITVHIDIDFHQKDAVVISIISILIIKQEWKQAEMHKTRLPD